jgi:hypothetical protein
LPKQKARKQTLERRLIAWYKWEFLRRNVDYRKSYEAFIHEFGPWFDKHGYWFDETVEPWGPDKLRYFASAIAPKAEAICKRWQTRDLFSPDWNFKRSGEHYYRRRWKVFLPTDCSEEQAGEAFNFANFYSSEEDFEKGWPRSVGAPEHRAVITLDLRSSLSSLIRQAKEQLTSRKTQYDKRHPQSAKIGPAVRRRLDCYGVYLEVWDRRTRDREKYLSIGAAIFGVGPRVEQRAMDSFKTAKKLINGGYKELR